MMKPNSIIFENDKIILRTLREQDLNLTLSWRNQDDIRKWFVHTDIIPIDSHYQWFNKYKKLDNDFIFIIIAKDFGNIPVGQISLYKIDYDNKTAEYGRLMIGNSQARGKGYAKLATKLLIKKGFEYFLLKEIYLEVKENNYRAINVYFDCGFKIVDKKDNLYIMKVCNE